MCIRDRLKAQDATGLIRLNQIGFYPGAPKVAIIADVNASDFIIKSVPSGEVVFKSKVSQPHKSEFTSKTTSIADFSSVNKPGTYELSLPGTGNSYTFEIKPKIFNNLTSCLLYTSDAADEEDSVDLGGRR